MPRKWRCCLRYLNERFFRFPKNVAVKAREGWDLPVGDKGNFLRTVGGMEDWLSNSGQSARQNSFKPVKSYRVLVDHAVRRGLE